MVSPTRRTRILQLLSIGIGAAIWMVPVPDGLQPAAWHLFAIFSAAIFAVVSAAASILVASIVALVVSIFSGTLEPSVAYGGFSQGFILLIVVAFLVGKGVVNSGLGMRIAYLLVRAFGRSSLGLAYSMVATDAIIAPAFPSNTARSGVLFPIVESLALSGGSSPHDATRTKVGAFLVMTTMASIGLSSGLWMTAMAANPVGVALASRFGVELDFASWLLAASVPMLLSMLVVPWILYRVFPPDVKATPDAPRIAAENLRRLGKFSRHEWIATAAFVAMVTGWGLSSVFSLDVTAVAFAGLAIFLLSGVIAPKDIRQSGDALETLIWFAILFTLSSELDNLGFMRYVGDILATYVDGMTPPLTFTALTALYVLLHYLFVSQTAHMLALFSVFLGLSQPEVPAAVMAMSLLLANSYFSVITPHASSANVIFVGSGYVTAGEVYRYGGIVTLVSFIICTLIGTPWFMLVLN